MAKKQTVNKTKAVHAYLNAHPRAKSSEIAEALTKQGIEITRGHVSNIRSKSRKRRRAVRAVSAKSGVGIPELKAAFAFLKACGSASAAKEALAAAEEIKAMVV